MIERAAGSVQIVETTGTDRARPGRGPGRPLARLGRVRPRRALRLRLRPRRRAHQGRPARAPDRRARRPGRQLDRRRDLGRRAAGRRRELRAGRREGVRRRHARAGGRDPGHFADDGKRAKVVGLVDTAGPALRLQPLRGGRDLDRRPRPIRRTPGSALRRTSASSPTTATSPPTAATTSPACSARTGSRCSTCGSPRPGARRILDGYGRGEEPLPVYKMPHLRGLGRGRRAACSCRRSAATSCCVVDRRELAGGAAASPCTASRCSRWRGRTGAQVWVNFAHPAQRRRAGDRRAEPRGRGRRCSPGKAVLHMEFTPRGEQVWISARDDDKVVVYDTATSRVMRRAHGGQALGHLLHRARQPDRVLSHGRDPRDRAAPARRVPARLPAGRRGRSRRSPSGWASTRRPCSSSCARLHGRRRGLPRRRGGRAAHRRLAARSPRWRCRTARCDAVADVRQRASPRSTTTTSASTGSTCGSW